MGALALALLPLFGAVCLFLGCIMSLSGAASVAEAFTHNTRLRRVYMRDAAACLGAAVVAFALAGLAFA